MNHLSSFQETGNDDEAFARMLQEQFLTEGLDRGKENEGNDIDSAHAFQHSTNVHKNKQTDDDEAYARIVQQQLWKNSSTTRISLGSDEQSIDEQRLTTDDRPDRINVEERIETEVDACTAANAGRGLHPTSMTSLPSHSITSAATKANWSRNLRDDDPHTATTQQRVDDYRMGDRHRTSSHETNQPHQVSRTFARKNSNPRWVKDNTQLKIAAQKVKEKITRSFRGKDGEVSTKSLVPNSFSSFLRPKKKAQSLMTSGHKFLRKKTMNSISNRGRRNKMFHNIPQAEHRGITVAQMKIIANEIQHRCVAEEWKSTNLNYEDYVLKPEEVTFHDLLENYINPITKGPNCSYVDTVADQAQTPEWFVSHWWGQPVLEVFQCIEKHASDRAHSHDASFWISAFALNPHIPTNKTTPDESPEESSFWKAMKLTKGFLSIVDSESMYYTRLWCNFEVSVAMKMITDTSSENKYLHDIYTLINDLTKKKAIGLTDGFAASDKYKTDNNGNLDLSKPYKKNRWILNQAERQSAFPIVVCREALGIRVEESQVSRIEDKWWILHYLCGETQENHIVPPTFHMAYNDTNALLKGKFASLAYRHALEAGEDLIRYRRALKKAPLESTLCSFSHSEDFLSEAFFFTESLPVSLKVLALEYDAIQFTSSDQFALGFARLKHLTSFKLNVNDCGKLSSLDSLWDAIGELENLEELRVRANHNSELTSMHGIGNALTKLTALNTLLLDFSGCTGMPPSVAMQIMHAMPLSLEMLILNLRRCPISSFREVFESIGNFTNLRNLRLGFCNTKLTNIDKLGASLSHLHNLQSLHLDFSACQGISSISNLILGLSRLDKLSSINFNFENCSLPLHDCYNLEEQDCLGLSKLTKLHNLTFHGPPPSLTVKRHAAPGKTLYPTVSQVDQKAQQVVKEICDNALDGHGRIANLRWLDSEICFVVAVETGLYDAISMLFADDAARSLQDRLECNTFCWLWPVFHGPLGKGHRNAHGIRCSEYIKSSPIAWVNWIEAATSLAIVFPLVPGSISGRWQMIQNIWAFTISALSDQNVGHALVSDCAPLKYTARRMEMVLPKKRPKDPIGEIVLTMMYQATAMLSIWCNLLKPDFDFEGILGLDEARRIQYDSAFKTASAILYNQHGR